MMYFFKPVNLDKLSCVVLRNYLAFVIPEWKKKGDSEPS